MTPSKLPCFALALPVRTGIVPSPEGLQACSSNFEARRRSDGFFHDPSWPARLKDARQYRPRRGRLAYNLPHREGLQRPDPVSYIRPHAVDDIASGNRLTTLARRGERL